MSTDVQIGTLKRGDTWRASFLWKALTCDDAGNVISRDPIDLTGCTARLHLSKSGLVVLEASTTTGELQIDGPTGEVSVSVEAAVTGLLESGTYKGDLEITYPDGTVHSSETFSLPVLKDITV